MGRQLAVGPVAVRARWRHQRGKARDEFEWREVQLVGACPVLCPSLGVALVWPLAAGLAVLFGAAVDQLTARFAQPLRLRKLACAWPTASAVTQVAGWNMMRGGEVCEAASAPSPSLPTSPATSSNTPSTAQTWKCTCSFRLAPKRWMKATAPMCKATLSTWAAPGLLACSACAMTRKKMRMHHAQRGAIALREVPQPFGHRQYPLAHRQAGEDVVAEVCRRLGHAPRGARGADAPALA